MFTNYIKEVRHLNQIDLLAVQGIKLYYSKLKNTLDTLFLFLLLACCIWQIIRSIENNATVLVLFLLLLMNLYALQKSLSHIFCKNPVLILSEGKLYCLKTQTWYPIEACKFEDKFLGNLNLNLTFCMEDPKGKGIFALKNWNLRNPEDVKSKLHFQRAMIRRSKEHT